MKTKNKLFIISIMLAISFFLNTSCEVKNTEDFPSISYNTKSLENSSALSQGFEEEISSGTLKFALPITEDCAKYLTYMYIGEKGGLFRKKHTTESGHTIPLEILEEFNVGLTSQIHPSSLRGLSSSDYDILNSSGELPDIFLIQNYGILAKKEINAADLNSNYTDKYLNSGNIYPTMFSYELNTGKLTSLPFHASVEMLYANKGLLSQSLTSKFSGITSPISMNTLRDISKSITDKESGIFGFMGFKDLTAFLPSATSPFPGNYLFTRGNFDFQSSAFSGIIKVLKEFASDNSSIDSLSTAEKIKIYGELDPIQSGKIAFWTADSSQISTWDGIAIERFPLPIIDRTSLPLHVSSVVVNANSKLIKEAKELAAYITMDKDAVLLRSRFNIAEGFIPVLDDDLVWELSVQVQSGGEDLLSLKKLMNNSHSLDESSPNDIDVLFNKLYTDYFHNIIFKGESLEKQLDEIITKAQELIR